MQCTPQNAHLLCVSCVKAYYSYRADGYTRNYTSAPHLYLHPVASQNTSRNHHRTLKTARWFSLSKPTFQCLWQEVEQIATPNGCTNILYAIELTFLHVTAKYMQLSAWDPTSCIFGKRSEGWRFLITEPHRGPRDSSDGELNTYYLFIR